MQQGYGFDSAAGVGLTGAMPEQGSPTLLPGATLPAGHYSGGSVAGIKVATGAVTVGPEGQTFYYYGGVATTSPGFVDVPVPSGAASILAVVVHVPVTSPPQEAGADYSYTFATPLGYADGATGTVLCHTVAPESSSKMYSSDWISGGALSLSATSIVLPMEAQWSGTAYYTVLYY